jgi:hypothetical protein
VRLSRRDERTPNDQNRNRLGPAIWLVLGAALAAATGCSANDARSKAQPSGSPVPVMQARRIAAQCTGRVSYVPTWLPEGFRLTSWEARSNTAACDLGPRLRFRRGSNELTWAATGNPEWTSEPGCSASGSVIGHLRGHAIRRRIDGSVEQAWTCLKEVGGRWASDGSSLNLDIVASQKAGSGAVTSTELARIVSSARPLPPGSAANGRFELVPVAEARRLPKEFGSPLFLPKSLPAGFIFSQAEIRRRDPDTEGRDSLFVDFGRDGRLLEWGVYAGREEFALECPAKKAAFAKKPFVVIHGIDVFLNLGAVGGSAWRCIPAHTVGNPKPLEVELWYDGGLDSPAMRRQVSEIVANARLVKEAGR